MDVNRKTTQSKNKTIKFGKVGVCIQFFGFIGSITFLVVASHFAFWRGGYLAEASLYLLVSIFGIIGFFLGIISIAVLLIRKHPIAGSFQYGWSITSMLIAVAAIGLAWRFTTNTQDSQKAQISNFNFQQSLELPKTVFLPIADRPEEPEALPSGWCGETSIQMGMGYFHKEVPQKVISMAGKPGTHELYYYNIDTALDKLGVRYSIWNSYNKSIPMFINWIKLNLAAGHPVLCGLKIHPTRHPFWPLDHFVLVVGYNERGIIVNTNNAGYGQILLTYSQLMSTTNHYSFVNSYNCCFGRALIGLK